jgi:hypothetical protein
LNQKLQEARQDEKTFTLGVLLLNREGQHLPEKESLLPGQVLSQLILNLGQ